jgi:hypothetical protein
MIVYDLECGNGHAFEGWFEDRKSFEAQRNKQLIACPICSDKAVVPVPSTFAIKGRSTPAHKESKKPDEAGVVQKALKFLQDNFEDVGPKFAQEALKMHYDVTDKRNIRGTTTENEEEMLKKEEIDFVKIPIPRLDS